MFQEEEIMRAESLGYVGSSDKGLVCNDSLLGVSWPCEASEAIHRRESGV